MSTATHTRVYDSRTFVATRTVTHLGLVFAFALDISGHFWYSTLLLSSRQAAQEGEQGHLDARCWSDVPRRVPFPRQFALADSEIVPPVTLECRTKDGYVLKEDDAAADPSRLDLYLSTTVCLSPKPDETTKTSIPFTILSDGDSIFLFRQSSFPASVKGDLPNALNQTILCDRFVAVDGTLSNRLEARFQRSRLYSNFGHKDTKSVYDMDDKPFFEPTLVLSFVRQVQDGRFTVLRSPVAQGNSYKWLFFVNASGFGGNRLGEGQFDRCLIHYACDVAKDGRFDLRGGTRYTCANESHEQIFALQPGQCSAITEEQWRCNRRLLPITNDKLRSECCYASQSAKERAGSEHTCCLVFPRDISVSVDFTLEMWINPARPELSDEQLTKLKQAGEEERQRRDEKKRLAAVAAAKDADAEAEKSLERRKFRETLSERPWWEALEGTPNPDKRIYTSGERLSVRGRSVSGYLVLEGLPESEDMSSDDGDDGSGQIKPEVTSGSNLANIAESRALNNATGAINGSSTNDGHMTPNQTPQDAKEEAENLDAPSQAYLDQVKKIMSSQFMTVFGQSTSTTLTAPAVMLKYDHALDNYAVCLSSVSDQPTNVNISSDNTIRVSPGSWTHLAFVHRNGKIHAVINGRPAVILEAQNLGSWRLLGQYSQSTDEVTKATRFRGMVSDLRWWNVSWSDRAISVRRSLRLLGTEESLSGYWPMNDVPRGGPSGPPVDLGFRDWTGLSGPLTVLAEDSERFVPVSKFTATLRPTPGVSRRILSLDTIVPVGGLSSLMLSEQASPQGQATQARLGHILIAFGSIMLEDAANMTETNMSGCLSLLDFDLGRDGNIAEDSLWAVDDTRGPFGTINVESARSDDNSPIPNGWRKLLGSVIDRWDSTKDATMAFSEIYADIANAYNELDLSRRMRLMSVDPQGLQISGLVLDHPLALLHGQPPTMLESATGHVRLYTHSATAFDEQPRIQDWQYNAGHRSIIELSTETFDGRPAGAFVVLRPQTSQLGIEISEIPGLSPTVAVDMRLTAELEDGTTKSEFWPSVPSDLRNLKKIMQSSKGGPGRATMALASLAQLGTTGNLYVASTLKPLERILDAGTLCKIRVGNDQNQQFFFLTAQMAAVGSSEVSLYRLEIKGETSPAFAAPVAGGCDLIYDDTMYRGDYIPKALGIDRKDVRLGELADMVGPMNDGTIVLGSLKSGMKHEPARLQTVTAHRSLIVAPVKLDEAPSTPRQAGSGLSLEAWVRHEATGKGSTFVFGHQDTVKLLDNRTDMTQSSYLVLEHGTKCKHGFVYLEDMPRLENIKMPDHAKQFTLDMWISPDVWYFLDGDGSFDRVGFKGELFDIHLGDRMRIRLVRNRRVNSYNIQLVVQNTDVNGTPAVLYLQSLDMLPKSFWRRLTISHAGSSFPNIWLNGEIILRDTQVFDYVWQLVSGQEFRTELATIEKLNLFLLQPMEWLRSSASGNSIRFSGSQEGSIGGRSIGDIRLWDRALSWDEIQTSDNRPNTTGHGLVGSWFGLDGRYQERTGQQPAVDVACVSFEEPPQNRPWWNTQTKYFPYNEADLIWIPNPTEIGRDPPLPRRFDDWYHPDCILRGSLNGFAFKSDHERPCHNVWTHVAMTIPIFYALHLLNSTTHVNLGKAINLDLGGDLSIGLNFGLGRTDDVIIMGRTDGYKGDGVKHVDYGVPFEISIRSGKLCFSFAQKGGNAVTCALDTTLKTSTQYRLAISRAYDASHVNDKTPDPLHKIIMSLREDSGSTEVKMFEHKIGSVAGARGECRLGLGMQGGTLGQLKIWQAVVPTESIHLAEPPKDGMVAWYRFQEGAGKALYDSIGSASAAIVGANTTYEWQCDMRESEGDLKLYVDGQPVGTQPDMPIKGIFKDTSTEMLMGKCNGESLEAFEGHIAELRIHNRIRSMEEINDTLYSPLGDVLVEPGLVAYFDMTAMTDVEAKTYGDKASSILTDRSLNGFDLVCAGALSFVSGESPVGDDPPFLRRGDLGWQTQSPIGVAEYGEMEGGSIDGVYKRCYSAVIDGDWWLYTGYKVGTLQGVWVCQVQTDPTVIGYIEGAPPLPGENFFDKQIREYHPFASSTVKLLDTGRQSYTYHTRTDRGWDLNASQDAAIGAVWDVRAGVGVDSTATKGHVKAHLKAHEDVSGAGHGARMSVTTTQQMKDLRAEVSGQWESNNGAFLFNNYGVALVRSTTADVYGLHLRMKDRRPLVAYSYKPSTNIPPDVNLLPFPINPRYVKQGCLDGMVGLRADPDYEGQMVGTRTDASYYKPAEAYALKKQIEDDEAALQAMYASVNYARVSKDLRNAQTVGQALEFSVADAQSDYVLPGNTNDSGKELQNAAREELPKRTKRSLVNEYVWSAQAGFFAQTVETIDHQQEDIGGNFNVKAMRGASLDADAVIGNLGLSTQFDVLMGAHYTLTQSKQSDQEATIQILVDINQMMDLRTRHPQTQRLDLKPGSVDGYRFMTFYLEPSQDNFEVLFNKVIDPEWLAQSTESSAAALREAYELGRNHASAYRVLHRVTYVSRVLPKIVTSSQTKSEPVRGIEYDKNWSIIAMLDPHIQAAQTVQDIQRLIEPLLEKHYPSLNANLDCKLELLHTLAAYRNLA